MREGIHPEAYRFVVFKDMSNGMQFLGKSTAQTKETVMFEDGKEYPVIKLEISNTSHPFTLVKTCWLTPLVVLINSTSVTPRSNKRETIKKHSFLYLFKPFLTQVREGFLSKKTFEYLPL